MKTPVKLLFTFLAINFLAILSYSQPLSPFQQWVATYNNPASSNDYISKMTIDNSGNVYMTGRSDSLNGGGTGKTVTIKYNSNGSLQWERDFTAPYNRAALGCGGMSAATDNSGNIYVLAVTSLSQYFNNAVIIKYSSSGDTIWTKTVADTTSYYIDGGDIKTDGSGNIYAACISASLAHTAYIAVTKLTPDGQISWQYYYQGPAGNHGNYVKKLILDNSGNVYVAGKTSVLGAGGLYWADCVTFKLNNSGVQQWASTYDGPGDYNDYANDIALDANNNVYVTGSMTPSINVTNVLVLKYDGNNGTQQWAKNPHGTYNVPNDLAYGITLNQNGDIYVCGLMFDNGAPGTAVLLKMNNNGDEQWRRFYPVSGYDQLRAVTLDSTGNVLVTGDCYNSSYAFTMTAKYNSTGDMLWNQQFNTGTPMQSSFLYMLPGNAFIIGGQTGNVPNYDLFAVKYLQVSPQTTTICKSINKPIRDFQSTFDTINVSGISNTAVIINVQVKVDTILHTYVHDLVGTLKGPSGLTDTLFKQPGKPQPGLNIIGCNISDTASHLLDTSATAPFTGNYKPYHQLSSFSGNSVNGNWIFGVYDAAGGDTGTVNHYCITISYFDPSIIGIQTISNQIPNNFSLAQNYPNPFNPTTNIKFSISNSGNVALKVFDILGRQVAVLVNEYRQAGTYLVDFNASNFASGVYFYRIETKDFTDVKKMVLVK